MLQIVMTFDPTALLRWDFQENSSLEGYSEMIAWVKMDMGTAPVLTIR